MALWWLLYVILFIVACVYGLYYGVAWSRWDLHPDLLADSSDWSFYLRSPSLNRLLLPLVRLRYRISLRTTTVPLEGVNYERRLVPAAQKGGPDVAVHIYEPERTDGDKSEGKQVLFYIHGGGFVLDWNNEHHVDCAMYASKVQVTVVAVQYRIAPENPFPAPLDDCCSALLWTNSHFGPSELVVIGSSAGGGLAAGMALKMLDTHPKIKITKQVLLYPMLEDRPNLVNDYQSRGDFVWTEYSNQFAWDCYLAGSGGSVSEYAAPARRENLEGLPPTWIGVGSLDWLSKECVEFHERLKKADVQCQLDNAKGTYQASHLPGYGVPTAPVSICFRGRLINMIRRTFGKTGMGLKN